jgi:osmoprotectant transport system ATP-binding protein
LIVLFHPVTTHDVTDGKIINGPAVVLTGVARRYGAHRAVDDISLTIAPAQFVALVGASGSGKSTLLRMINRMVIPDSGSVTIAGQDVRAAPAHMLRRRIGTVIQGTGLFPHITVGGNIAMSLRITGVRDTDARVAALLAMVDLPREFSNRLPASLSGGQRQRVGFARALANAPGLMLMDEPFGALDPITRDALGRAYRALHDQLALTSVMVTHDMAEALLLADRVIMIDRGRIVADATPAALMAGDGGAAAQALVAVPRDQAARLARLISA